MFIIKVVIFWEKCWKFEVVLVFKGGGSLGILTKLGWARRKRMKEGYIQFMD